MHWFKSALSKTTLICLILALTGCTSIMNRPFTAEGWQQAAIADINEGYEVFYQNHPGVYGPDATNFKAQLNQAKAAGLAYAQQVNDAHSYQYALAGFSAVLDDSHAMLIPRVHYISPTRRWPGFAAVWRKEGMVVSGSTIKELPVGAEVISCDNKPIKEKIVENIFAFTSGKHVPGRWWSRAGQFFVDNQTPFISLPQQCIFKANDRTFTHELVWRELDEQAKHLIYWKTSFKGVKPAGLYQPRPGLLWASLPTFSPNADQRTAYEQLFTELSSDSTLLNSSQALVIDLRKNGGGNSGWGYQFSSALWGQDAVNQRLTKKNPDTEMLWRLSEDNFKYFSHRFEGAKIIAPGAEQQTLSVAQAMKAAQKSGQKLYRLPLTDKSLVPPEYWAKLEGPTILPRYTKPVYVISAYSCGSACLDALDIFTLFANTTLIGSPTSADTDYLDVRYQETKSGRAQIKIPLKMYVNRPRGNNEVYFPDIYVNDFDWSTRNFIGYIERDLQKNEQLASPVIATSRKH